MDPEAFFNWDAMDDDDLDTYPNSSFINSNFEHSVFTEAILHPSFAEIQQPSYESSAMKRYSNYELNQQQQLQQPIKQEPTGLVNYIFSDFYGNAPSYQQPSSTGINPRVISNYNQNNQNSSVFLNPNSSHQGKYLSNNENSNQYSNNNSQLLSPLYSNTFQMHRQQQQQQQQQNNFIDITVDEQPPVEVRTRTPGENRTFSLKATVSGNFRVVDITAISVKLLYANTKDGDQPRQTILGGTKAVPIADDGVVVFDNLCMTEASTKHAEKEFTLEFYFIHTDGRESSSSRRTTSFYAYSHKKVLTRRKNISLRALSKQSGPMVGGGEYHVVGTPFIKGPALKCVFKTPHGDIEIKYLDNKLDRYSETVLFFTLPPYPRIDMVEKAEIAVSVQVTNDGRNFSNELPFIYYYSDKRK